MKLSLTECMVLAATAGGAFISVWFALTIREACLLVLFIPMASVPAVLLATPFALVVGRLYGDLPLSQRPAHRAFWCALAFLLGSVVGGVPLVCVIRALEACAAC